MSQKRCHVTLKLDFAEDRRVLLRLSLTVNLVFLSIFVVSMCLFNGDCVVYVLTLAKSSRKMEKKGKDKDSEEKPETPR